MNLVIVLNQGGESSLFCKKWVVILLWPKSSVASFFVPWKMKVSFSCILTHKSVRWWALPLSSSLALSRFHSGGIYKQRWHLKGRGVCQMITLVHTLRLKSLWPLASLRRRAWAGPSNKRFNFYLKWQVEMIVWKFLPKLHFIGNWNIKCQGHKIRCPHFSSLRVLPSL